MPAKDRATWGREPRRYEIRVRGPIGPTMMQAFPRLAASRSGQDTLLTGALQDECAPYGVIHQLGSGDGIGVVSNVSGSLWIPQHGRTL
jgi:hypothetical protein